MAKRSGKTAKVTLTLDVGLVARMNAAAYLRSQTRDAFASAALDEACRGLVLFDRGRKNVDRSGNKESVAAVSMVENSEPDAA